jgi:N-acetyl-anhydromuramyl-L-alanine amidase AmpD
MSRDNTPLSSYRAAAKEQISVWFFTALLLMPFGAQAQDSRPPIKFVDRLMLQQSSARTASNVVDHIVVHFCSDVIAHPDHPYDIDRQIDIFKHGPASANYLIARDGTVYLLVPENRVAWHAGNGHLPWDPTLKSMNQRAIGIETFAIGSPADMKLFGMTQEQYDAFKSKHPDWVGFSDAQYATLKQLIDEIRARHPTILADRFHIIGHEEWAGRARRTDPGELFDWTRIGLTRERPATNP